MNPIERKRELIRRLEEVRARTLHLFEHVPEEFLNRRVHEFYSPIGWHFGHVGRTEDYWISCAALKGEPFDADLDFLYTDRPDNPKDARVRVPDRAATIAYLAATRERVVRALEEADLLSSDPFLLNGYAWDFAIQHECQHQETICEMLMLIQKQLPQGEPDVNPHRNSKAGRGMIALAGGTFEMGTSETTAYDNEQPPYLVSVAPFRLAQCPVTCQAWSEFINDEGYERPELWSVPGWNWKGQEGAVAPEYWVRKGGDWLTYQPFGIRHLDPQEPVFGISHFEAEAFARWSGKRLPTETEWEFAAQAGRFPWGDAVPTDSHARFGMTDWGPAPVGTHGEGDSPEGIQDLAGNVWEWTQSPFLPYPGFAAFPYDGYSKDHMKGEHRVCRGGSWATAAPILRRTFRNWYVPTYRQGFLGMRLAETV